MFASEMQTEMQTTTQTTTGPGARFGAAKGTFTDYGIRGFRTAFTAQGDPLDEAEAGRLQDLWYNRIIPTEDDLPLIERLEAVADKIRAASGKALHKQHQA